MHKTKGQKREEANERRAVYRGLSKDKNLKRARSRRGESKKEIYKLKHGKRIGTE